MTFSEIQSDTHFLLGTNSTSYPIADLTRNVNNHLNNVISNILEVDYNWRWDDSAQTDLPIGTTTLVNGQQDYSIAGSTFLKILRVEVLDANGKYQLIEPLHEDEIATQSLTEYSGTNGLPKKYIKLDDTILLYPTPATGSVTMAAGLKVYYQRPPSYFVTTDTTKTPGFNPLYHKILSFGAALDYAVANDMNNKIATLTPQLNLWISNLRTAYTRRPAEQKSRMLPKVEDTR